MARTKKSPDETRDQRVSDPNRARLTAIVHVGLAERLRNAVDALQGPPLRLRMQLALERAVRSYVESLERKHNNGRVFDQRPDVPLPKA